MVARSLCNGIVRNKREREIKIYISTALSQGALVNKLLDQLREQGTECASVQQGLHTIDHQSSLGSARLSTFLSPSPEPPC